MPCLFDTNILVYANNLDSPFHEPCRKLLDDALNGRITAYIAHQNLLKMYAVVTDKRRVENPLTPESANSLISFYLSARNISILYPSPATFSVLGNLIANHNPISHGIFDLVLVALMIENNITTIHTANTRHFSNFKEIKAIAPFCNGVESKH
jgi:predicted nucleic acid-binding protein